MDFRDFGDVIADLGVNRMDVASNPAGGSPDLVRFRSENFFFSTGDLVLALQILEVFFMMRRPGRYQQRE